MPGGVASGLPTAFGVCQVRPYSGHTRACRAGGCGNHRVTGDWIVVRKKSLLQQGCTGLRKNAWSRVEMQILADMWLEGAEVVDISRATGRSLRAVRTKACRLGLTGRKRRSGHANGSGNGNSSLRNCLRCDAPFYSSGAGNRICTQCKSCDSWRSGGY